MIKLRFKFLLVPIFLTSTAAFADNSDTATITIEGDIIQTLSVSAETGLRFGEVAQPDSGGLATSVTIAVSDQSTGAFTVSYENNGSPDVSADDSGVGGTTATNNRSVIGPGKVNVTGEPNFFYAAGTDAAGGFVPGLIGGVSMRVDTSVVGTRQLDASGEDAFFVGGKFTVPDGAPVLSHNGIIGITVTYD